VNSMIHSLFCHPFPTQTPISNQKRSAATVNASQNGEKNGISEHTTSGKLEESRATQTDLEKPMKILVKFFKLLISKSHILFSQHGSKRERKSKTLGHDILT
jgi:hypothetical protein